MTLNQETTWKRIHAGEVLDPKFKALVDALADAGEAVRIKEMIEERRLRAIQECSLFGQYGSPNHPVEKHYIEIAYLEKAEGVAAENRRIRGDPESYGRVIDLETIEGSQRVSGLIEKLGSETRAVAETAALMLVDSAERSRSKSGIERIAGALRKHGFTDELRRVSVKLRMASMSVEDAKNMPKAPKEGGKEAAAPQKLTRK